LVSALLFDQSKPAQAFNLALEQGDILLSHSVLKELIEVLGREKLRPYLDAEERERFIVALLIESLFIDISETIQVCRDPEASHEPPLLRAYSSLRLPNLQGPPPKSYDQAG